MTEREKIAQIIAEHLCPQGRAHKTLYGAERMCYSRNNFADCEKVSECVDALIEAGYGDVKDCREYYKQAHDVAQRAFHVWDEMFVKLWETETQKEEAEHRAEVAEKALRRKCESEADNDCPYDENSDKCKECAEKRLCSTEYATQCYYERAIQQAEREIGGEKDK